MENLERPQPPESNDSFRNTINDDTNCPSLLKSHSIVLSVAPLSDNCIVLGEGFEGRSLRALPNGRIIPAVNAV